MKWQLVAPISALAAACAVPHPQNAEEFRQYVPTSTFAKVETFEAKRPLRDVAKTFQAKAPECLNIAVRTVERSSTHSINVLTTYKPTVLVTEKKAELHVQIARTCGCASAFMITSGPIPAGSPMVIAMVGRVI